MKRKFVLVIGVLLAFGLIIFACDNENNPDEYDIFKGTWIDTANDLKIVAENGSFKQYLSITVVTESYRGTYTCSGNTVTFRITEVKQNSGNFVSYADAVEDKPPNEYFSGTISGNTMTSTGTPYNFIKL